VTSDKSEPNRIGGPWKPGQSGNPKGRPPGFAPTTELRKRIAKDIGEIVDAVTKAAKNGDIAAARLLLERVLPALKPIELPIPIPMPADGKLVGMGDRIMLAAGEGVLAPGQASVMMAALASLAKIRESEELERRIAALEEGTGK